MRYRNNKNDKCFIPPLEGQMGAVLEMMRRRVSSTAAVECSTSCLTIPDAVGRINSMDNNWLIGARSFSSQR